MATSAKTAPALPVLNPHAAGIDIGATEIFVAVPSECSTSPVRHFATFTADLQTLADWLDECHIKTVAMESTGVYWIPLYQILEARGLEVYLVNAHHLKNVPGHKSDVDDCQWIQYLHACGLLHASFRPEQQVCVVRSLLRHRENLVAAASIHVQHLQKALTQMNLQLHNVITDITGKTGLAILDAIFAGERDPDTLAAFRDPHIKASQETIAKSLVGDYRFEHLFVAKQALGAYRYYQQLIAECDQQLEAQLARFEPRVDPEEKPLSPPARRFRMPTRGHPLHFKQTDLRTELSRLLGVDLTEVPGLGALTLYTLFSEIGRDLSAFPTYKHFCSWLGLCPNNRISGGRVLSSQTRKVKSRASQALRMAAEGLCRSQSALGDYYRKMRARLGPAAANTAAAHKLARIIYHLLTTGESYDESVFAKEQERARQHRERKLKRDAIALGYKLVPEETPELAVT
jgi:transposase